MAKDKERTLNPAAAALKASKKSALKKSKAAVASQRNERLAKQNPERLQRQIDELKATESAQGGSLKPRDKQHLEQLEREVRMINKAREAAGITTKERQGHRNDKIATANSARHGYSREGGQDRGRGGGNPNNMILGKRRRSVSRTPSPPTDEDVRSIPMPRDTPPPIPPHSRRLRDRGPLHPGGQSSNTTDAIDYTLPQKPKAIAQTTYSSAPQLRNLAKESTARFVPNVVASKLKARDAFAGGSGTGSGDQAQRLLEPEELDRLEKEGYIGSKPLADEPVRSADLADIQERGTNPILDGQPGSRTLEEEEAAFERELEEAQREIDDDGVENRAGAKVEDNGSGVDAETVSTRREQLETANVPRKEIQSRNTSIDGTRQQPRFALVEDVDDDTW